MAYLILNVYKKWLFVMNVQMQIFVIYAILPMLLNMKLAMSASQIVNYLMIEAIIDLIQHIIENVVIVLGIVYIVLQVTFVINVLQIIILLIIIEVYVLILEI
jgi:hypothetical protein